MYYVFAQLADGNMLPTAWHDDPKVADMTVDIIFRNPSVRKVFWGPQTMYADTMLNALLGVEFSLN